MEFKNIMTLNVNSVATFARQKMLIDAIKFNQTDLVCINETHLKPNIKFKINNFNIFRNDRTKSNGGGVAIILNNKIKFKNLRKINNSVEAIILDVLLENEWYTLISIYIPPNGNLILNDIQSLFSNKCRIICGGDFNARFSTNDISKNSNGNIMETFFVRNINIRPYFTQNPTCHRSKNGTWIDFFIITDDLNKQYSIGQSFSFSDHDIVILKITFKNNVDSINYVREIHSFSYTNVGKLNAYLNEEFKNINILKNDNYINDVLESIVSRVDNLFIGATEKFVPKIRIPTSGITLSRQTIKLRKSFRSLSKKLSKNFFSANYAFIKKEYVHLKNMYTNSIKFDIVNHFKYYISKVRCNADIYEIMRHTTRAKKSSVDGNELIGSNNKTFIGGQRDTNNEFANFFFENNYNKNKKIKSIYEKTVEKNIDKINNFSNKIIFNDQLGPLIITESERNEIDEQLIPNQRNFLTYCDEITDIIKNKKKKQSHGYDKFPISIFKFFNSELIEFITCLLNHLLANQYFPNAWKRAILIPIPKIGKDNKFIKNHRPISQLTSLSKIFEKVIDNRMEIEIEKLKLLPNSQYGFRKKISTQHSLVKFTSDIANSLNDHKITTAISLDLSLAFDSVWHNGLLFKLYKFGFNLYLIKIIQSFLMNRSYVVGSDSNASDEIFFDRGVPQGSVISPKLFNLFLIDIPKHKNIKCLQFADDILIYHHHRSPLASNKILNEFLKTLASYYKNWKLNINETKTNLINFYGNKKTIAPTLKKRNKLMQNISINNVNIQPKNNIKFLGINFDTRFNFIHHINNIISKINFSYFKLSRILKNQLIDIKFKNFIYKMYIRPIIGYGSASWLNPSFVSAHQIERIRITERKILRKTSNIQRKIGSYKHISNKKLYDKASIKRIDRYMIDNNVKFFKKCSDSKNDFLMQLVEPYKENKYLSPSYIFHYDQNEELFVNNKLMLFHRGLENPHKMVYSTEQ